MTDPRTHLIHHPYQPPEGFTAPQPGVFKASTVVFPNVAAMRERDWKHKQGYTYGLHGTPTTFTLEERIATLEGGLQCVLVPSGLAAIANVALALLKTGDEVLIPDNAYGPNKALAEGELAACGITHQLYDPMDVADLAARITPRTKLVWLEAAGSVTMEFPDLIAQARLCRERGVVSALDNTWGAGLAFNAFDLDGQGLGVDVSAHALTKYPSGGGDVLMGSVTTRDEALHLKLKLTHMRLGLGVGANDAEAVLRALPSIGLRYHAQDQAARTLAGWCAQQRQFVQVDPGFQPDRPAIAELECALGDVVVQGKPVRAVGRFGLYVGPGYPVDRIQAHIGVGEGCGHQVGDRPPLHQAERMQAQCHGLLVAGSLVPDLQLAVGQQPLLHCCQHAVDYFRRQQRQGRRHVAHLVQPAAVGVFLREAVELLSCLAKARPQRVQQGRRQERREQILQ